MELATDKIGEVRAECIAYAAACLKMLDLEADESKILMECKEKWKDDQHILVVDQYKLLQDVMDSSEEQKEHWRILRCIRN